MYDTKIKWTFSVSIKKSNDCYCKYLKKYQTVLIKDYTAHCEKSAGSDFEPSVLLVHFISSYYDKCSPYGWIGL